MPSNYLRSLSSKIRHNRADLSLARYLTFTAGAANAGGFLAVQVYTSHMSGLVASISDSLILGNFDLVFTALSALASFMAGAATTAMIVNWAKRKNLNSAYALPLLIEAALLLLFGLVGGNLNTKKFFFASLTVVLLCFLMGLQNALITKISNARIRTTHVTGIVTDIGIELGKLLYWNKLSAIELEAPKVQANSENLKILLSFLGLFFLGGLIGAVGFKYIGFSFTFPLAVLITLIGVLPAWDDLRALLATNR